MSATGGAAVRFGFLGAGFIARRALAPAVHAADDAVLQAVAARDEDRARALEPAGRGYTDYRGVLDDPEVDVVYVSLANDAHLPWTLAALEAGKHVLCEKPLGLDAGEARRMVAAAEGAGRLLVEAWWYRWHPRTRRAEELVASGALGRVARAEAAFCFDGDVTGAMTGNYRLDPARGGGALLDVGCYAADALRWALGGAALQVRAADARWHDGGAGAVDVSVRAELTPRPGGEATAGATGDATVGAATTSEATAGAAGPPAAPTGHLRCAIADADDQLVAVYGEQATLVLGGQSFTTWHAPSTLYLMPASTESAGVSRAPGRERTAEPFAPVDPYRLMVEAVAQRVRGEEAWLPEPADSVAVAETTDAVRAAVEPSRPALPDGVVSAGLSGAG